MNSWNHNNFKNKQLKDKMTKDQMIQTDLNFLNTKQNEQFFKVQYFWIIAIRKVQIHYNLQIKKESHNIWCLMTIKLKVQLVILRDIYKQEYILNCIGNCVQPRSNICSCGFDLNQIVIYRGETGDGSLELNDLYWLDLISAGDIGQQYCINSQNNSRKKAYTFISQTVFHCILKKYIKGTSQ
ncbi:unnamed protein product [Paramecium primaurelia]|uniref:Uncharacterized protein n=1 Tax=Paramecium primaurelia TaxID=5886 RepID=A0A8S1K8P1_PARPR|nr:unnamed protein product [Paramecium primaurelia]